MRDVSIWIRLRKGGLNVSVEIFSREMMVKCPLTNFFDFNKIVLANYCHMVIQLSKSSIYDLCVIFMSHLLEIDSNFGEATQIWHHDDISAHNTSIIQQFFAKYNTAVTTIFSRYNPL